MRRKVKKLERAAQLLARGLLRIVDSEEDQESPADQYAEALAAIGLQVEGELDVEEVFELWPDNVVAFNFWRTVQTQWLYAGMGVATGLNYQGVKACMELRGIPKKAQAEIFAAVQVMEAATLREWAKQK